MIDEGPYVNGRVPPHEQTCDPGDLHRAQDIETIAYLREALAESKRETQEARAAAADVEPWLWSDDDTAKTVESMGNLMTVRITGGHLRALIAGAVELSTGWLTAAQISDRWDDVPPFRVGQIVRMLGLCALSAHVRASDGVNEYSPAAVGLIERELRSRGGSRP